MSTARDIVKSALRRIRILGKGEDLDAGDASDTLSALNAMMHQWKAQGLTYEHTTMELNTTFPLDDSFEQGVVALLGVRISEDFGDVTLTQRIVDDADEGWRLIAAEYWKANTADFDDTLKCMPSQNLSGYISSA